MHPSQEPLRTILAGFINRTSFEEFPAPVIRQAKLCILDLIGVSFAGSSQQTTSIVRELFSAAGGNAEATVWTSDRKVPVQTAALVNAVQGHAIDMDDGHRFANGHPGVVTIPAAFAVAEKEGLTGRELIEAVVVGYEMFIRLGTAANPDLLMRGFHTTATIGAFASAAAVSKLLGLNQLQTENALSLAGLQSAGLLEALASGESGKSFQAGKASQSGVLAGLMARSGADGPTDIFEGQKGFFRAFAGKDCDRLAIGKDFGRNFQIMNVYCKKHAACRHIHTPLDATAEIVSRSDIDLAEISSIEIETYSIAKNLTGHLATQDSELAAKFSTPIAVALYLVFGKTDFSAFNRKSISDPRVQAIAKKVRVRVNPARDVNYPRERSARVTIHTTGRSYEHEMPFPKGEPESPLSEGEFIEKYEQNAGILYSKPEVDEIKNAVMNLEYSPLRDVAELLAAPSRS